ncbi:FAD-dependent oxidoreductase [Actinokineospora sp. G85]|uniref:FAD-dependent oxidoreductase n=1 Tax=Actinokineospora sp. G85 TaxID=3406626 RepID=UPI003C7242E6
MSRAVVAGGSVAGLAAARVLSQHVDEVLLVEPDVLPRGTGARGGVPHGEQMHVLLGLAQSLLDHWFAGVTSLLRTDGAVLCDSRATRMCTDGVPRPLVPGFPLLPVRRTALESRLRDAVLPLPSVRLFRDRVVGLHQRGGRVTGVALASGRSLGEVDLVVDATGRGSRGGEWLRHLGYAPPPRRRLKLDLGYATALFHRSADHPTLDGLLSSHSTRTGLHGAPGVATVAPVTDSRWSCLVSGYGDDRPTASPGEFRRRCLAEPAPGFADLVRRCAPAGPVRVHRFPHAQRRDHHLAETHPEGFVAVGDAVVSCNPVYGQGIPSALLHASALDAWLSESTPAAAFFERTRALTDAVWQTSAPLDARLPHVTGDRPPTSRLTRALTDLINASAHRDEVLARRFAAVVHMREHPSVLARPSTVARAVLTAAKTRISR